MKKGEFHDDDSFDLMSMVYDVDKREMQVRYCGIISTIRFRRVSTDPSFDLWLVPGDEVSSAFLGKGSTYLGSFLGGLFENCHAKNVELPLSGISLSSIQQAAIDGRPFGELASAICTHRR